MGKALDLDRVFAADAEDLRKSREHAQIMHPTDLRAAGDEVEEATRAYFRRVLPPGYRVTTGHLIDSNRVVSPQVDIIITDNMGLGSLVTSRGGTEYVPITSVYALGEVKATYYHRDNPIQKTAGMLQSVADMDRPLVENTRYGGLKDSTLMIDIVRPSRHMYLNNLFTFMICVDGGDFTFERVRDLFTLAELAHLPTMTVLLNEGMVLYARRDATQTVEHTRYPNEVDASDYDWCFVQGADTETGSAAGSHLATLYSALVAHLVESYIEPPNVLDYTRNTMIFRQSSRQWALREEA